jgi:hypothetical protein
VPARNAAFPQDGVAVLVSSTLRFPELHSYLHVSGNQMSHQFLEGSFFFAAQWIVRLDS